MVRVFQNKVQTKPFSFRLMPLFPVSFSFYLTLQQYGNIFSSLNTVWWVWGLVFYFLSFLTLFMSFSLSKMPCTGPLHLACVLNSQPAALPWPCFPLEQPSLTLPGRAHHSPLCDHVTLYSPLLKLQVSLVFWGLIIWTFAVMTCKNVHPSVSTQIRNPSQ